MLSDFDFRNDGRKADAGHSYTDPEFKCPRNADCKGEGRYLEEADEIRQRDTEGAATRRRLAERHHRSAHSAAISTPWS